MAQIHNVPIDELASRITLKITGLHGWHIRLRVARWLFALGAWIAGVNIVMETPTTQPVKTESEG